MGCCLTTDATTTTTNTQPKIRDTSPPETIKETVKEVLPPITSTPTKTTLSFQPEEEFTSKNIVPMKNNNNPLAETASEVSSEIYTYSYTASLSAATTTTMGTGVEPEEDGEVTQKVNKPSHVKIVSRTRKERGVRPQSLSQARKPVIRSMDNNIRLKKRTGTQCSRQNTLPSSLNVVSGNVVGKDHCVRRMRSPAVRDVRRVVRKENSGKCVPVNEVKVKFKKKDDVGVMPVSVSVSVPEKEMEMERGESLENPLVSLECFIFL